MSIVPFITGRVEYAHWFVVGPTGTGKTTVIEKKIVERWDGCSIVGIFPHHDDAVPRLVKRRWRTKRDVVWDSAGSIDRVLALKKSLPSLSNNQYERQMDNEATKDRIIEGLLARRLQQNVYEMPLIEDGLDRGLGLWLNQDPIKPESWIKYAFRPQSKHYRQMVAECIHEDAVERVTETESWTPSRQLETLLPAKRAVEGAFGSPIYQARLDGDRSLGDLLDDRQKVFFEGHPKASRAGTRWLFITVIHEVCKYVERGARHPVILVIDEASSWLLVDPYLCRMFQELRKKKVEVWISVQNPIFGDPWVTNEVMTNCTKKTCFRPETQDVAEMMGYVMGMPLANPYAIQWIEERWRQVHAGYDTVKTLTKNWGTSYGNVWGTNWSENQTKSSAIAIGGNVVRGKTATAGKTNSRQLGEDGRKTEGEQEGEAETFQEGNSRVDTNSIGNTKGIGGSEGGSRQQQEGFSEAIHFLSRFELEKDEIPHYFKMRDQVDIMISKMMQMETGEAVTKLKGAVHFEKVARLEPVKEVACLVDLKTKEIQGELKKLPYYKSVEI